MSDPVVESPLAIGAIGIVRRYVWPNKGDLTLQVAADATMDRATIDDLMDTITHIADREQLKVLIAEKEKAIEIEREQPMALQKEIDRLALEKDLREQANAAIHANSNKRGPYRPNAAQTTQLERYDAEIANARKGIEMAKKSLPITEWQLACLKAKRDGKPAPEAPPNLIHLITDTMDMAAE